MASPCLGNPPPSVYVYVDSDDNHWEEELFMHLGEKDDEGDGRDAMTVMRT